MAKKSLYPPAPADVPANLTATTSAYMMQTLMVVGSLGLFFMLYFGLMFFCVLYAAWALFLCPRERDLWPVIWLFSLALIIPAGVLFIYMLKNIFKFQSSYKPDAIEIFEDEHPKLFEFIHQVCDDVGAAYPHRVYVDFHVTAAAIPETSSIFNLILPTKRSLLIGLGLVNAINLTEFKALLAHEFGHFAQGAKVGYYFQTMVKILYHAIYGEDWFDRLIVGWSRLDPRIAWPAYIVRAALWCLRKILELLWFVIFFFYKAFRRQREFNADLFAVSLTGSDAPVHLLARCDQGYSCWQQAAGDLRNALENHIYTADFFYHQAASLPVLRKKNKENRYRVDEPPPLPNDPEETTQVFEEDDDRLSEMWEDHPSSFDREQNAKATYIRSEFDERSPWLLFDNVEELRERVTYKFYRYYFKIDKDVILADPVEVQGFIDEEHGDRTYAPKFQGLYDNRNLIIKGLQDMAQEAAKEKWSITELGASHATLYTAEVKHRSQLYYKRLEEKNLMIAVFNGWHKPKDDVLEFRGENYEPDDAKRLLKKVEKELEGDYRWMAVLDRKVFLTYFQMAMHIDQAVAEELYRRYEFHLELQNIWIELNKQNGPIDAAVNYLNSHQGTSIASGAFEELLNIFREAHKTMRGMLKTAKGLTTPGMKNVLGGHPLRQVILEQDLVDGLSKYDQKLSIDWINGLLSQFREMKNKVDRLHYKSLAGILTLQEKIANECTRRWAALPKVKSAAT